MKPSRSHFLDIRGLRYHLREWGDAHHPALFMLHGWMDGSASFQFVVDAFQQDWCIIAPDWRGFGLSGWNESRTYWFPDYLADLDTILALLHPDQPAILVGHSMGGNIAALYAGIRPDRVARLVILDGFGLMESDPEKAPERYRTWLDELIRPSRLHPYPNRDALAARLQKNSVHLQWEQALWLAEHLAEIHANGEVRLRADPAHKQVNPILYRRREALACWQKITAPILMIEPASTALRHRLGITDIQHRELLDALRHLHHHTITNSGHNLHHDQPARVANLIENFLGIPHSDCNVPHSSVNPI